MTRVASVGYATPQGLGHLHKWYYDAGVITDPIVFKHTSPLRQTDMSWFPSGTPMVVQRPFVGPEVEAVLERVKVMLFFETPFDWSLIERCRERGVKTVLMPMYEWTPRRWPAKPDYILAPSALDYDYFAEEFKGRIQFIPVPVDDTTWAERRVARRFLHNAGNVGHREHKGTRQLVEAIPMIKSNAVVTIRAQDRKVLESILQDNPNSTACKNLVIDTDPKEGRGLWDVHDVYASPEKFNGLTLPPVEAYAAGMPVITTDRYPLNSVLPQSRNLFIKPASVHKACINASYLEFDECVVSPESIAEKIDEWYGQVVLNESYLARSWARDNSWSTLKPVYDRFMAKVAANEILGGE